MTIEDLSDFFSSRFMFILWTIPLIINIYVSFKLKSWRYVLIGIVSIPFLIYFGWAMTGYWSTHEIAKIFNRTTQIVSILLILILTIGCYEHH